MLLYDAFKPLVVGQCKGAISQLRYQCGECAQWTFGATRRDDSCVHTVLLETQGPCAEVYAGAVVTQKHMTQVHKEGVTLCQVGWWVYRGYRESARGICYTGRYAVGHRSRRFFQLKKTTTLSVVYALMQIICVNYPASLQISPQYTHYSNEFSTHSRCVWPPACFNRHQMFQQGQTNLN